jgi:hypothetical protein
MSKILYVDFVWSTWHFRSYMTSLIDWDDLICPIIYLILTMWSESKMPEWTFEMSVYVILAIVTPYHLICSTSHLTPCPVSSARIWVMSPPLCIKYLWRLASKWAIEHQDSSSNKKDIRIYFYLSGDQGVVSRVAKGFQWYAPWNVYFYLCSCKILFCICTKEK